MANEEPKSFRVTDRRGEEKKETEAQVEGKTEPAEKKEPSEQAPPGKIDFATFVISMSTSALVHLGLVENPDTGKKEKNIEQARQDLDLLTMIEEKTRGNLSPQEKKMMDQVMYELRVRFIEASK